MDKPRIYVDFNELVDYDVYLLSKEDAKVDSAGNMITFYEGMPVSIYTDDASAIDEIDNIVAEGVAIRNDFRRYGFPYVKWCCRVYADSIMHESDLKFLRLLPEKIKKYNNDLFALREILIEFRDNGMDKESMLENLQRLRAKSDPEIEDILLELMDLVDGFCNLDFSI